MYLFNRWTICRILHAGRYLVRLVSTSPELSTQHKEEELKKNCKNLWEFLSTSVSQPGISDLPPADGKRESPPAGKVRGWAEQPRLQRAQPPTLISSFAGRRRVSFRSQRSHGKAGVQRALGLHRLPSSLTDATRGIRAPAVDYRWRLRQLCCRLAEMGLAAKEITGLS